MPRYIKNPIVVEAIQFTDDEAAAAIQKLSEERIRLVNHLITGECAAIMVESPSGTLVAGPGDWIVQGAPDDLYVVGEDRFHVLFTEDLK